MIPVFLTRLFRNRGIGTLMAGVLFATLSVAAQGADEDARQLPAPQTSAVAETVAAISSGASARVASDVTHSSTSAEATPSLDRVMDILQAQGQEIASLRAALRDQQELTARLAAKLNATSAEPVVSEAISSGAPALEAGAGQSDLAHKVAQLETQMGAS